MFMEIAKSPEVQDIINQISKCKKPINAEQYRALQQEAIAKATKRIQKERSA